jgi:hypothetical protein
VCLRVLFRLFLYRRRFKTVPLRGDLFKIITGTAPLDIENGTFSIFKGVIVRSLRFFEVFLDLPQPSALRIFEKNEFFCGGESIISMAIGCV